MTKPRTDHAAIARERLAALVQAEEEIAALRKALARAKAGDDDDLAAAELDAFASIRAELGKPATWAPSDIAEEVERMAGRLKLLEEFMGAVEEAYGTSPENLRYAAAELKRFASIPDECLDLAEALAAELGPEPAVALARRLRTIPAYQHTRTVADVAAVLAQT